MLQKIFSVYDSKAEAYMSPFFMVATGQAIRSFVDTATDAASQLGKHPEDFTLFELGTYDDLTAEFCIYPTPKSLGLALELIPAKL